MKVEEVEFGSTGYEATLALRKRVLRDPLGLEWTDEEKSWEPKERHFSLWDAGALVACVVIRPLDEEAVLASIRKTGCVVTCEEHNRFGGLGDVIAQVITANHPVPQEYVAVNDTFGESGKPAALLHKYGLSVDHVVAAPKRAIARKG